MPSDALIQDLLDNPNDWNFDPQIRAYRRVNDGALVTESAFVSYKGGTPAPRRGRVHVLSTPPPDHTTVMWRSHGRFTYVAIYVAETCLWYISGTGAQYNGNQFGDALFRDYILRDERTDGVSIVDRWNDLMV